MNKYFAILPVALVVGMFVASGLIGLNVYEDGGDFAGATNTALSNLTDEITTLLTDIIPVFVILGVFGAVIAYVGRMTKGFGQ